MLHRDLTLALAVPLLICGCRSGPTVDAARDLLREGRAGEALDVARRAASLASPEERVPARRLAFEASLAAGSSVDAAREYELLRRLVGHDDEALLADLAASTLRLALHAPDPCRRLAAVEALATLAADPRGAALARAALGDARPEVRAAAVRRCAAIHDGLSARALLDACRDPSARVRREALDALVARHEATALGAARVALSDVDEGVRCGAILAVAALAAGEERSGLLRHQVALGSDAARETAALALLASDGPAAAWAAWREAELPAGAPRDAVTDPLAGLGRALRADAEPQSADARASVRAALEPTSPWRARTLALRGLSPLLAQQLAADLARIGRDDPSAPVRGAALGALGRIDPQGPGGEAARRALGLAAQHPAPATRAVAFRLLLASGALEPAALVTALGQDDPALSADVVLALRARDGEAERAALVAALDHAASFLPALEALAAAADRSQRERFLALLDSDDLRVRLVAARGVGAVGDEADRRALLAALEAPDEHDDLPAAAALLGIQERLRLLRPGPPATAQ